MNSKKYAQTPLVLCLVNPHLENEIVKGITKVHQIASQGKHVQDSSSRVIRISTTPATYSILHERWQIECTLMKMYVLQTLQMWCMDMSFYAKINKHQTDHKHQ